MNSDQMMRRVNLLTSQISVISARINARFNPASPDDIGDCASLLKQIDDDTAELGGLLNDAARQAPPHDLPDDTSPLKLIGAESGGTGGAA